MADELSKVQECVDQLATQMFACLHWISQNAIPAQIPGQPFWPPEGTLPAVNGEGAVADAQTNPETQNSAGVNGADGTQSTTVDTEQARRDYQDTLKELAQDLVIKEQQIEGLIKELPGLDRSQEDQERKIRELEQEAKELEVQAKDASEVREGLIKRVEDTMMKIRRV